MNVRIKLYENITQTINFIYIIIFNISIIILNFNY